jgi:hypothetical protein
MALPDNGRFGADNGDFWRDAQSSIRIQEGPRFLKLPAISGRQPQLEILRGGRCRRLAPKAEIWDET